MFLGMFLPPGPDCVLQRPVLDPHLLALFLHLALQLSQAVLHLVVAVPLLGGCGPHAILKCPVQRRPHAPRQHSLVQAGVQRPAVHPQELGRFVAAVVPLQLLQQRHEPQVVHVGHLPAAFDDRSSLFHSVTPLCNLSISVLLFDEARPRRDGHGPQHL